MLIRSDNVAFADNVLHIGDVAEIEAENCL